MFEFTEYGIDFIGLDRRTSNLFHVLQEHGEQIGRSRHSVWHPYEHYLLCEQRESRQVTREQACLLRQNFRYLPHSSTKNYDGVGTQEPENCRKQNIKVGRSTRIVLIGDVANYYQIWLTRVYILWLFAYALLLAL